MLGCLLDCYLARLLVDFLFLVFFGRRRLPSGVPTGRQRVSLTGGGVRHVRGAEHPRRGSAAPFVRRHDRKRGTR